MAQKCAAAFQSSATYVPDRRYPHLAGAIRHSNSNIQAVVGFKTRV
jgi:hypothetical protein